MRTGLSRPSRSPRGILGRLVTLLVVLLLALPTTASVAGPPKEDLGDGGSRAADDPDEWLTFKGDKQRTGVAASEAPSVDKVLWVHNYTGSVIYSSPTVWNETVYLGVSGTIKAIWAKNGSERWTYTAPNPVHSCPVIDDGVIYAGVNNFDAASAVAVDALTGQEVWNATIPDFVTASPLVLSDSVYFGCENGLLYCLKRSDGKERWNFTTRAPIRYSSIAYHADSDTIFFGTMGDTQEDGQVFALDARNGDERWNATVVGSVWASPTVDGDSLLVSTAADNSATSELRNGYIYSFNVTTGQRNWRTVSLGMVFASPSVSKGRAYVGTWGKTIGPTQIIEPKMYCIDVANGSIVWNKPVVHGANMSKVWSSVTISGSKLLFGDELGFLNVWNTFGIKIWDYKMRLGSGIRATPAVAMEMVFAANIQGDVVGFGSQPDLAVNATNIFVEDEYPHLGQRVRVKAKITNIGDKTATGRVFLYNGSLEDWRAVINGTTVTLEPGRSTYVYAIWIADELGNRAVWVRIIDVVPNEAEVANNEALRVLQVLPPSEGWLTGRSDPTGDGFMATEPPSNNLTKWLSAEGEPPGPGLAATTDAVFFPVGERMVAYRITDGEELWAQTLGGVPTTPPGVGDGSVFVGTDAGTLLALDLEDGTVRFARTLDGLVSAGPIVVGTTVLVGTDTAAGGGTLYALDTFDGSEIWTRDMDNPVNAHPAVANDTLYAISDQGALLALDLGDGELEWQFPVGNRPGMSLAAAPVVRGERLYILSTFGFVYCLDADPSDGIDEGKQDPNGSGYDVIWTYKQEEQLPFNHSPVLVGDLLVVVVDEREVLALGATNGSVAWSVPMDHMAPLGAELIAVNDSVVVSGRGIRILSTGDGFEHWKYDSSNLQIAGNPAAVDDMLFVADSRGILFAFGRVKNQPPVARIFAPETDSWFRINESIVFDGSTSSDDKPLLETSFRWDFGDGNTSLARKTSHSYGQEGWYTVTLTVTDTDGDSDNTSINVRIQGNHDPILDWYRMMPDSGMELVDPFNFSVRYTDPDDDPPEFVTVRMSPEPEYRPFNMLEVDPSDTDHTDGKTYYFITTLGSRPYPEVTFRASDGIATVERKESGPTVKMKSTVANSVGDIEVTTVHVGPYVTEYHPVTSPPVTFPPGLHPIGVFVELYLDTIFLESANISINYTFHDTSDMDVTTLGVYRWVVSGSNASWEYVIGSQVDLTNRLVTAPIPSLRNDIYTILGNKQNPPENNAPVAIIKVDGEAYSPGATVRSTYAPDDVIEFDGLDSYDPDERVTNDRITDYAWSFGDGQNAKGKQASHSFSREGKYVVTLTVTDSFEKDGKVTVIINVREEGDYTLIYLILLVCIIVILILLFWPKGERAPSSKDEDDDVDDSNQEVSRVDRDAQRQERPRSEEKAAELDSIIDELEETRNGRGK